MDQRSKTEKQKQTPSLRILLLIIKITSLVAQIRKKEEQKGPETPKETETKNTPDFKQS